MNTPDRPWARRIAGVAAFSMLSGCGLLASMTGRFEPPELRIQRSRIDQLSATRVAATLRIEIFNPNPYALEVEQLRYAVKVGGAEVGNGAVEAGFTLASDAVHSSELPLTIQLSSLAAAGMSAALGEVPYELRAAMIVRAPLLERQVEVTQHSVLSFDVPLGLAAGSTPKRPDRLASAAPQG